jgi:glycosyltransferase involved in cell wall biosynthesis
MIQQNKEKINIVFFHSRVAGYLIGFFEALIKANPLVHINVVHWDHNIELPFDLSPKDRIQYHSRASFDSDSLFTFLENTNPQILTVSGWMDKGYLKAARKFKKKNKTIKIVCGLDDSWRGTPRQIVGVFIYKILFRNLFEYVWTSGKPQYAYATVWGYPKEKIIQHFASADIRFFNKKVEFSKRIIYLGRFSPEKGLSNFLEVYDQLSEEIKSEWPLVLIGDGPLKNEIIKMKSKNVVILPFMEKQQLLDELNKGGVFCLPSFAEQWGVVVHELAILGYPMLLTSICGANTEFLIEGYNGYSFNPRDKSTMNNALSKITSLSNENLEIFSERSHLLGTRINTEIAAFSMLAILQDSV